MEKVYEFRNLNDDARKLMIAEIEADIAKDVLYYSELFTDEARRRYPDLLRQAALGETPEWLRDQLLMFDSFVPKNIKTNRAVNKESSAQLLAGDEFNKFYCRAMCLLAVENGFRLKIYRARESSRARPTSLQKIGECLDAHESLRLFRERIGTSTGLGVSEVGSGLSLELIK